MDFKTNDDGTISIHQQDITCKLTRGNDNSLSMYVEEVSDHLASYVDAGKTYNCFRHSYPVFDQQCEIDPKHMEGGSSQFLIWHERSDPEIWSIEIDS